jgi:hypothetical protein
MCCLLAAGAATILPAAEQSAFDRVLDAVDANQPAEVLSWRFKIDLKAAYLPEQQPASGN